MDRRQRSITWWERAAETAERVEVLMAGKSWGMLLMMDMQNGELGGTLRRTTTERMRTVSL